MKKIDPKIRALAEEVIHRGANRRAIAVLKIMIAKGEVSTDEIQALGYNHPPRAIGDVRDAGIPIVTEKGQSISGKRMAIYTFGKASDIQDGRIGGRSAFPKAFKEQLLARYGSIDCITHAKFDPRVLQIDHRIPYRVAADAGLNDRAVEAFMLLDGSSQRAKSWSCEHCPNLVAGQRKPQVCKTCFWAFPDDYEHIATEHIRRVDLAFQGADVPVFDALQEFAKLRKTTVAELLKQAARQIAKDI